MKQMDNEIDDLVSEVLQQENPEKEELLAVKKKRELLEKSTKSNVWGYSSLGIESKKAAMSMLSTKTGMFAKVPLYCKAEKCPYAETCLLLKSDLAPKGEPCPMETSHIEMRTEGYKQDYGLDTASFTDRVLMNQVIKLDILIDRCEALMSIEGTPVIEITAGVDEQGNEYTQPAVSKALEAHEKLVKRRNEIFKLMMGTRSDKKENENEKKESLQSILSRAIQQDENDGFIIDVKPEGLE